MLVNHFYGGMSPAMKKLLETICGGDFLSKHPDEAMDFLNYVAETSKGWNEPTPNRHVASPLAMLKTIKVCMLCFYKKCILFKKCVYR